MIDRRQFTGAAISTLFASQIDLAHAAVTGVSPFPIRPITSGPGLHWFGYYDKDQFDPTGRYVLGMRVGFDGRAPTQDDVLENGVIDLTRGDRWRKLGTSRAWGWQQGCMLQWVPGTTNKVIWNDREGDRFISRLLDLTSGKLTTLPRPIYAVSPDGKWAAGIDFSRIQGLRPGYGYPGVEDRFFDERAPGQIGLYRMSLETGDVTLLYSLAQAAAMPHQGASVADNFHWFNHVLINTDGTRITFLHRWRARRDERQKMAVGDFVTRMITIDPDGAAPFVIDPSGFTSHFVWRDPWTICAWTKPSGREFGFYLLSDRTERIARIDTAKMPVNGHQTYVPKRCNEWLLNDTYPDPVTRTQTPYLFHIPSDRRFDLGAFPPTPSSVGEWRCDLHPRASRDGNFVCIDSTHAGTRQMYLIDLRPFWSTMR